MGWRPGQGIGPRITKCEKVRTKRRNDKVKIYGCSLPSQVDNVEETDSESGEDATEDILFAPDDYQPFICNPKDNYFGIGYSGLDRRPVLSGHVNLFEEPTSFKLQEKNKKLSIRGQAFGVGAFEADDEDIYQRDDMSRYDFALGPEKKASKSRWSEKHNESECSKENYLEGFVPATRNLERKKIFEPPELPKDFEPFHAVRKSRFHPPIEPTVGVDNARNKGLARPDLSATDRARILGESSQNSHIAPQSIVDAKSNSVASNIITRTLNLHGREQTAERNLQDSRNKSASAAWLEKLNSKSFVSAGVENRDSGVPGSLKNLEDFKSDVAASRVPKPFILNPEKQTRFEKFVGFAKKGENNKLESIQPLSMTEWEREQERHEFEQATRIFNTSEPAEETPTSYAKNLPNDPTISGKFVSSGVETSEGSQSETAEEQMKSAAKMKLFGKLTRTREPWQPATIVCKRFNIPEPRSGCATMEKTTKNKRCSVFEALDFGGITNRFEGSTEPSETLNEPHVPYVPKENQRNEVAASTGILDHSEADASSSELTEKMRSFEVSYEKVFGHGGSSTEVNDPMQSLNKTNVEEERENSSLAKENTSVVSEAKNSVEKKDLFKAIFLSSSEDESENDEDEDDSEVVKSLLISKTPSQLNVQRNTSPPRGIFAKLDLDSLTKPKNILSSSVDEKSRFESKSSADEQNEKMKINNGDVETPKSAASSTPTTELLPDMYGPALPTRNPKQSENSIKDDRCSSTDSKFQKPFFKSVVVTKKDNVYSDRIKGKWVERGKSKKSKKDKHKHKHKEKDRSKHKHKSKKDKR